MKVEGMDGGWRQGEGAAGEGGRKREATRGRWLELLRR